MALASIKQNENYISTEYGQYKPIITIGSASAIMLPVIQDSIPFFKYTNDEEETSVTLLPLKSIEELNKLYLFSSPVEVKYFILNNDYLIDILFEADKKIKTIFGENIKIDLEFDRDPEEDFEELFVVIKSTYEPKIARNLMNRLIQEWFLGVIDKTNGKLNIIEESL